MKTVFDNQQCAHVWAQQTQTSGRSTSMRFDGATIYSYSTPIARIVQVRPDGLADGGVVLVTSRTYSATTSSKHMPAVRRAVSNYTTFTVDNCMASSKREHTDNLAEMLKAYDSRVAALKRVRVLSFHDSGEMVNSFQHYCLYASLFDLPAPVRDPQADWHAIHAHHDAARLKRETPAYLAKKAREAERNAAAELARSQARHAHEAEARGKWLNGDVHAIWRGTDEKGGAYLRIIHGDEVQTSLGARVPKDDATHAIAFIRSRMRRHTVWERNGETCRVGQFQIDRIEINGDIKAGCHFIQFAEIDRIGGLLGV